MKLKQKAGLLVALMLLSTVATAGVIPLISVFQVGTVSASPSPTTYYVIEGGDDIKDGLSWENAFATIQHAIDSASAGVDIIVGDGTYPENLNVDKENLTIRSENGAAVTIVQTPNSNDHVFEVTENNVSIIGFTMENAIEVGKAGIFLSGSNNSDISNNICSNNWFGIYLVSSSNNTLENNTCPNITTGIYLIHSDNNTLENNTCSNNTIGIYLYSSDNNTLDNNTCENNDYGIYLIYSDNNTLENNTCSVNFSGINLSSSFNNNLINNTCSYNTHGIYLSNSDTNTLQNNTCKNNSSSGIYLHNNSNNNILSNNTCSNNNKYGIYIQNYPDNNILSNNTCSNNNQYGIYLDNSSNNTLEYNTIDNNGHGICIKGTVSSAVIRFNEITNNVMADSGIHIEAGVDSTGIMVNYNYIVGNSPYGAYNGGTGELDATHNYWGDPTGPYHQTLNPSGLGDNVSDNVNFDPWLTTTRDVTLEPVCRNPENWDDYTLTVTNICGDNIENVRISVPLDPLGFAHYRLYGPIISPENWNFIWVDPDAHGFYKQIWWFTTVDAAEIAPGMTKKFGFRARSPTVENMWIWQARTWDDEGYIENSSHVTWTDNAPPPAPTLVWPENNENINDDTPNLDWDSIDHIVEPCGVSYDVQVDNDADFSSLIENVSRIVDDNYQVPVPLSENTHYWRVRAVDGAGNIGPWSSRSFTVDVTPPDVPTLLEPADGTITTDTTPTFRWSIVTDQSGVTYAIVVDNDPGLTSREVNVWGLADNAYTPSALADENYSWRVIVVDGAGNLSGWSSRWTLLIDTTPPQAPTLISPIDGENINDNTPNLDWESVPENSLPVTYDIWVDDDSDFSSPVESASGIIDDNYQVMAELAEGVWYWRVGATDNASNVGDNSQRSFRVDTVKPLAPGLISPLAGENLNDSTPTLDWSIVLENSLPVLYYVAVSDNSAFPYEDRNSGWITADSWDVSPALPDGVWYWRVMAKDNAGNVGDNSAMRSFRVDTLAPPAPSLVSPADGTVTNVRLVHFRWTEVSDPSLPITYLLQVDNDPDFSSSYNIARLENKYDVFLFNENFSWRVRAIDNAGNEGGWSSV